MLPLIIGSVMIMAGLALMVYTIHQIRQNEVRYRREASLEIGFHSNHCDSWGCSGCKCLPDCDEWHGGK